MFHVADLHTHSTASDGQYVPSELVKMAGEAGIEVMALTDHDTMDGLEEAAVAGRNYDVAIIPGVELSAREYHTFHILGYGFIKGNDTPIAALCREMKQRRDAREGRILQYLREFGFDLTAEEVEAAAGGDIIGRPHFAQAMTRRGYVSNTREAFDKYLDTDEFHERIETGKPPVSECIEAIKTSGGKASLAHPYQIGLDNDALDELVKHLTDIGLDAIECYYPKFTASQEQFYLSLASKYHLHITGGSDFHGEKVKPDVSLAQVMLDIDWLMG